MCIIKAESWHGPTTAAERAVYEEYAAAPVVEQRFVVAKDPFERIAFTSTPPSDATVGESYNPSVISSEALLVSFFSLEPSVCRIGLPGPLPEVFGNTTLNLEAPGTCTIIASQMFNEAEAAEAPEARQSFTVYGPTVLEHPSILPAEPPATQPTPQPTTAPTMPGSTPPREPAKKTPTNAKHLAKKRKKKTSANGGIPAKARTELLQDIRLVLHASGFRQPAHDIRAVLTNEKRVLQLEGRSIGPGFGNRGVYFVVARGPFQGKCHGGRLCPPIHAHSVIELLAPVSEPQPASVDSIRLMVEGSRLTESYPHLGALGVPVRLGPVKAHMAPSKHA